jgi:ribosome maturation protein Sdo1
LKPLKPLLKPLKPLQKIELEKTKIEIKLKKSIKQKVIPELDNFTESFV